MSDSPRTAVYTRRRALWGLGAGAGWLAVAGCTPSLGVAVVELPKQAGERTAGGVTVRAKRILYDDVGLNVDLELYSEGKAARLHRDTVLLVYEQLEYPVSELTKAIVPEQVELTPDRWHALELTFDIGRPAIEASRLRLLGIERAQANAGAWEWVPAFDVDLPARQRAKAEAAGAV